MGLCLISLVTRFLMMLHRGVEGVLPSQGPFLAVSALKNGVPCYTVPLVSPCFYNGSFTVFLICFF